MARGKNRTQPLNTSPAMSEAWRLFEAGDKLRARQRAQAVLAGSPTEPEAAEARELLERTQLPRLPLIVAGVLATATALLILLAVIRY